jgi:hypothetical protein
MTDCSIKPPTISVFICATNKTLQLEMVNTCPKDTNQWVHLERMLSWMLKHRRQLLIWIDEKKPASAPEDSWWLMTAEVRPLLELVNVTLVILQFPNIILSQQTLEIENLIGHLVSTMNMELMGTNDAFKAMQASEFIVVDHWRVKIENVSRHLRSQGIVGPQYVSSFGCG